MHISNRTTTSTTSTTARSHRAPSNSRRRRLATAVVVATVIGGVGIGAGSASAMTMAEWQRRCESSGGEWNTYYTGLGVLTAECVWVTSSGYSYDVYQRGRLRQMCGAATGGRESCWL